jgi:hypothetical protein
MKCDLHKTTERTSPFIEGNTGSANLQKLKIEAGTLMKVADYADYAD